MNHRYNINHQCIRCGVVRSGSSPNVKYLHEGKWTYVRPECIVPTNVVRVENEFSVGYKDFYFR